MSRDKVTLNSEEIKPVAIAIIDLRLSEGIIQSVSQSLISLSVDQSVSKNSVNKKKKFFLNFLSTL